VASLEGGWGADHCCLLVGGLAYWLARWLWSTRLIYVGPG